MSSFDPYELVDHMVMAVLASVSLWLYGYSRQYTSYVLKTTFKPFILVRKPYCPNPLPLWLWFLYLKVYLWIYFIQHHLIVLWS